VAETRTVYLDHLIPRENLRYTRPQERIESGVVKQEPDMLRLADLYGDHLSSQVKLLRKPDFQRATSAWTPDDCVALLDSVVNEQIVPSIIEWANPVSKYHFILDGAHRVSVILAWLNDDWGDKAPASAIADADQLQQIKEVAVIVRNLVKAKIGSFQDYRDAGGASDRIEEQHLDPAVVLGLKAYQRARFFGELSGGRVGFHILWVPGDHKKAEQSFLKINKSGKQLTAWETRLVENRDSRFARTVMSIAYVQSVEHYWPSAAPDGPDKVQYEYKIQEIVAGVRALHETLFIPPYKTPITRLQQPLLVASADKKPYYVAELLTIVEGHKGNVPETDALMKQDRNDSENQLIDKGWRLIGNTQDVFRHITGPSPKSLGLIPALYFYSRDGRYVRSLLYGLIYWLCAGDDDQILAKKRLFCAHRRAFEETLLANKEDLITGLSRKTGSGPEVTLPTAKFYRGLLQALMDHDDDREAEGFKEAYARIADELRTAGRKARAGDGADDRARDFSVALKSRARLEELVKVALTCGICGGMLDVEDGVQHDHIEEYAKGGKTVAENQRLTHPFCNNNRPFIEEIIAKSRVVALPELNEPEVDGRPMQLKLFGDEDFLVTDVVATDEPTADASPPA